MTVLLLLGGFVRFYSTWRRSGAVAALAARLGLPVSALLAAAGLVCCAAAAYAVCLLSCLVLRWGGRLFCWAFDRDKMAEAGLEFKDQMNALRQAAVQDRGRMLQNLKQNWWFPLSAMAFLRLHTCRYDGMAVGLALAFLLLLAAAARLPALWSEARRTHPAVRAAALLTAVGICLAAQEAFCYTWKDYAPPKVLHSLLPAGTDAARLMGAIGAAAAFAAVYVGVLAIWRRLAALVKQAALLEGIGRAEAAVYAVLVLVSVAAAGWLFARSQAFYGTHMDYDVIYTGDSPALVKYGSTAYLMLSHPENDLRQPLLALFAMPFLGSAYLFGQLLGGGQAVQAILLNSVQLCMLFAAGFMLAKSLRLTPLQRVCFVLLSGCTYPRLLFSLMMEQYVVACFWLALCVYLISERRRLPGFALWSAGGTLLTSLVLMPVSGRSPAKNPWCWLLDMVRSGSAFVALLLVCGRFDVLYGLVNTVNGLRRFTGIAVTNMEKLYQYSGFVVNCFVAPAADTTIYKTWQMGAAQAVNWAGIVLLVLCLFSAVLNRKKPIGLLAGCWVLFSAVMLFVFGWGTRENGLLLYTLYFGWAFLVLLVLLVQALAERLRRAWILPVCCAAAAVLLAVINLPELMRLVRFAIDCHPV